MLYLTVGNLQCGMREEKCQQRHVCWQESRVWLCSLDRDGYIKAILMKWCVTNRLSSHLPGNEATMRCEQASNELVCAAKLDITYAGDSPGAFPPPFIYTEVHLLLSLLPEFHIWLLICFCIEITIHNYWTRWPQSHLTRFQPLNPRQRCHHVLSSFHLPVD
jgi:hypothetical protein